MRIFFIFSMVIAFGTSVFAQEKDITSEEKKGPQLKLPDVLIYGQDTQLRIAGAKLRGYQESPQLIKPPIVYQPLDLTKEVMGAKESIEIEEKEQEQATQASAAYGRYTTANLSFLRWQKLSTFDYGIKVGYHRTDGQYPNSQFNEGKLDGNWGCFLSPKIKVHFNGEYEFQNYGLQEAAVEDPDREITLAELEGILQLNLKENSFGWASLKLGKMDFFAVDSLAHREKMGDRFYRLDIEYSQAFAGYQFSLKADFLHDSFQFSPDSTQTNSITDLRAQFFLPIGENFSTNIGIKLENLSLNGGDNESRISPFGKLIFSPNSNLGVYLTASQGYRYSTYKELWQINPFLKDTVNLSPQNVSLELEAGVEHQLSPGLVAKGRLSQTWVKDYGYWQQDGADGLFQFNRLPEVRLTEISFGIELKPSPQLDLNFGFSLYSDGITQHIPYREDYSSPIRLSYKIAEDTKLSLLAQVVGTRKIKLETKDELSPYLLLNAAFEKRLAKNITLFIEGNNLTNSKYQIWENFQETGISFEGGVEGKW